VFIETVNRTEFLALFLIVLGKSHHSKFLEVTLGPKKSYPPDLLTHGSYFFKARKRITV
jgi:hypothetical protein